MAFTLAAFDAQLNNLLEGDIELLSLLARYRNITSAVEKYSGDRPDAVIAEVSGDAGKFYPIETNLTAWVEGLSRIQQIEYPMAVIASDGWPIYLTDTDWQDDFWALLSTVQTRYLFLPNHAPAATETMRITYTAPYAWSASGTDIDKAQTTHGFTVLDFVYLGADGDYVAADNIQIATHQVTTVTDGNNIKTQILTADVPPADFFAVCHWAAGLCCQAMAAKFAKSKDSSIAVDSATHSPKSTDFAARAQEFFALYNSHLGIGEVGAETLQATGEFVDWDTSPEWPSSRTFIFRRTR